MAFEAPGLRAMPSTALAMALPCAMPQRPDAIAIPIPAEMTTQCPSEVGLAGVPGVAVCALITKLASSISASNIKTFFVIRFSLNKSLQEVVPGHLTAGLTLQSG